MSKKTCLDLPLHEIKQKIFNLSSKLTVALLEVNVSEPRQLQLHIRFCERETKRQICFDKLSMLELFRQLRQQECVNIEYPCATVSDIGLSVKPTSNIGEYQIAYGKSKLILDRAAVSNMTVFEVNILSAIRTAEYHYLNSGYDVTD